MSFISRLLEHTKEYESPTSFWRWSSYTTIAAVLRDNVYYKHGHSLTFPNIYTLLLADSGVSRKARPVELSNKLLNDIKNTKIIAGRSSIQAILLELSRVETDRAGRGLIQGGSAIFYAPELSAGLVMDPSAITVLTNIYDYHEEFSQALIGSGKITLKRVVFSAFFASNLTLLKELYDKRALSGGLLARTFLITPDEYRPPNPLTRPSEKTVDTYGPMLDQLRQISELRGQIQYTEEGAQEYENWYKPFYLRMQKEKEPTGVFGRLQTSILKLAMILAVNDLTMFMTKDHVEEAIDTCMSLLPAYKQLMAGQGKSTIAEAGQIILAKLLAVDDYKVDRATILRDHWADFDAETLDKLIITLEQGGLVRTHANGSKLAYQLTDKCVESLKGKVEKKV